MPTELGRVYNLYVDGDRPGGLDARLNGKVSELPDETISWIAGDRCALRVYFRRRGSEGEASTPLELPADYSLVLCGKLATALRAGAALFSTSSWSLTGTGTDDARYEGTLDLTGADLAAALAAASTDYIDATVDLEVRDASNTERQTYQIPVRIYHQVYGADGEVGVVLPSSLLRYYTSPSGNEGVRIYDRNGRVLQTLLGPGEDDV